MAIKIPYKADRDSLYNPDKNAKFFQNGKPTSDDWLCAEMSRLAYVKFEDSKIKKDSVKKILSKIGFTETKFCNEKGTQCFATKSNDLTVISFRGTESDDPTDISTDADLLLKKWDSGGKVHSGFKNAYNKITDKFIKSVLKNNENKVLFTGHSLGAAIATLAITIWPQATLYTFGSPPVGDKDFKSLFKNITAYRYVDCCDILGNIYLPPYPYVGKLCYIDRNGKFPKTNTKASIKIDQLKAHSDYLTKYTLIKGNVAVRFLADHAPINYVSAFTGRK